MDANGGIFIMSERVHFPTCELVPGVRIQSIDPMCDCGGRMVQGLTGSVCLCCEKKSLDN